MAPKKRRNKGGKKAAKASKSKKAAKASKSKQASKAGKAKKPARAKSAYMLFCIDQRAEVLHRHGLSENPNFGETAKLLAVEWAGLDAAAKDEYAAWATLDKHRVIVDAVSVRAAGDATTAGKALGMALAALGAAPPRSQQVAEGVVSALEGADKRMVGTVRTDMGRFLGLGAEEAMLGALRGSLGSEVATRIAVLLQQWGRPVAARACASGPSAAPIPLPVSSECPSGASSSAQPGAGAQAGGGEAEDIRNKVVGMLMRTISKAAGKAHFQLCRRIEGELFELLGKELKEYKRRARSLAFNLGAADGALLQRVVDEEVSTADLVRLGGEELASDTLKAERKEERERYFKEQVHDEHGPPKRRRDLYLVPPAGRRKSEADDLPDTQGDSQPQASQETAVPARAARRSEGGLASALRGTADPIPLAPPGAAKDAESSSDSSSGESQDSSSSSSSGPPRQRARQARRAQPAAVGEAQGAHQDVLLQPLRAASDSDAELARALDAASPTSSSPPSPSESPAREEAPREPVAAGAAEAAASEDAELARALQAASPTTASSPSSAPGSPAGSPQGAAAGSSSGPPQADMEAAKAELLSMGFDCAGAEAALRRTDGSVESAVALLCGSQP